MGIDLGIFNSFPKLETRRLILREILMEDASKIFEMRRNKMVNRFINRTEPESLNEAIQLCKKCADSFTEKKGIGWTAVLKDSNKIIGTCGFNKIDYENERAEIGGELSTEYWGKNYPIEAVSAIIAFGFDSLKLHSIEALVNPQNRGAIYTLESIGFKKEAHFRERINFNGKYSDMAVYGILQNEFNTNNIHLQKS